MLTPRTTRHYRKDLQVAARQGKPLDRLYEAQAFLIDEQPLPRSFRDHPLKGEWRGLRELHLAPDWLLVYRVDGEDIIFTRLGSHAELFGE